MSFSAVPPEWFISYEWSGQQSLSQLHLLSGYEFVSKLALKSSVNQLIPHKSIEMHPPLFQLAPSRGPLLVSLQKTRLSDRELLCTTYWILLSRYFKSFTDKRQMKTHLTLPLQNGCGTATFGQWLWDGENLWDQICSDTLSLSTTSAIFVREPSNLVPGAVNQRGECSTSTNPAAQKHPQTTYSLGVIGPSRPAACLGNGKQSIWSIINLPGRISQDKAIWQRSLFMLCSLKLSQPTIFTERKKNALEIGRPQFKHWATPLTNFSCMM